MSSVQEISELSLYANYQEAISGLLYSSSVLDQEFFGGWPPGGPGVLD